MTRGGAETDGARVALLSAAAAHHAVVGETVNTNHGPQLPWRLTIVGTQGATRALIETGAAEGALTAPKVDPGKAAVPGVEQALRAGADALAATIAALDEQPFLQCPGRAHGTTLTTDITAEELRSSNRCLHHAAPLS
jgi:hypothetical protein